MTTLFNIKKQFNSNKFTNPIIQINDHIEQQAEPIFKIQSLSKRKTPVQSKIRRKIKNVEKKIKIKINIKSWKLKMVDMFF